MILTYKYRIKDNSAKKMLNKHAVAVNQIWNYCNSYQKDIQSRFISGAKKRKWPTAYELMALTKGTSKELGIHAQTIQGVCNQFVIGRDKARGPLRFRSSFGSRRSLGWVPFESQSRKINGNSIIYWGKSFRFFGSKKRPLPDNTKGGCFVEDAAGKWYVCFYSEVKNLPLKQGEIGIDLGLKTLATCSNGNTVSAMRHFRNLETKLAVQQRARNKGRVRAIHAKIANCRRDQLHKASCKIARENSLIIVGNVSPSKLKRTKMAKSVSDAGWGMFKNMLDYKARRHQARFIVVNERYTSQTCSDCGVIGGPKGITGLGIRNWECSACGASHDRDVNAARNILRIGRSVAPLVEESQKIEVLDRHDDEIALLLNRGPNDPVSHAQ